ncbi:AraC family transcriptional regulator [Capsulimonas corticalis]|uniref:AraC family transcriptional regulator n=1 Tax=Capsulimonas corticalis TaxID=2219043 RepID=A0A402CQU9_9BACT|nr:AraC family transcriptional regulator [Capsulimonas corticalis]BDI34405.1 AraC family transcriptional regulator [Capsulimonas corticalis]
MATSFPSNFSRSYPGESALFKIQTDWASLSVDHLRHEPGVREAPPLPYHLITFAQATLPTLVQKRAGLRHTSPIQRGEITITPAGHDDWRRWTEPCEMVCIWLEERYFQEIAAQDDSAMNGGGARILSRFRFRDPHLEYLASALLSETKKPGDLQNFTIDSLRNLLAVHLLRHHSTIQPETIVTSGGLTPRRLRRAVDFIHDHLGESLDLDSIAESAGLSSYHFSRCFKHAMGISPHQYVIQQRVEHAKRLIRSNDLPIGDIAYQVGFGSQSHLNYHFRRLVGVNPTQFQNQAQE